MEPLNHDELAGAGTGPGAGTGWPVVVEIVVPPGVTATGGGGSFPG